MSMAAAPLPPSEGDSGGRARALGPAELSAKVLEYEAFADSVLKARLAAANDRRVRLEAEREELEELRRGVLALRQAKADGKGGPDSRRGPPHARPRYRGPHPPTQEGRRELKSLVDLGAGAYCRARVPDATRIYVAVGLGFHVECSLEEAAEVAERRREALQAKVDACLDEAAEVRAHIRFVAQAVAELQQLGQ